MYSTEIKIEGLYLYIDNNMEDGKIYRGNKSGNTFCMITNKKTADILILREKIKQREIKLKNILNL